MNYRSYQFNTSQFSHLTPTYSSAVMYTDVGSAAQGVTYHVLDGHVGTPH
jgi:hypothetical protein